jgi:tryptophanyl-tRNA synthetase
MKTVLTGIQPTGKLHIGNYFGAIKPTIDLSMTNKTILFIADLHSLTSIEESKIRQENTYSLLASLIALGFDFSKNILFKQSDVPEVSELMFYLSCLTPFNTLKKAHAFNDKDEKTVNSGVFTYPVLMAADILLYNADIIPVGKDQLQHLEIARTLANKFNVLYGNTFTVPEPYIMEKTKTVIGTDGRKMSKSYNNYIDPFAKEEDLRKTIFKIKTSSAGINDPKDPETCPLFQLYSLFAFQVEIEEMKNKYASGISYSEVKQTLFNIIVEEFSEYRDNYYKIINEKNYLDAVLITGKLKAREISSPKIKEIKTKLGF